MLGDIYYFLGLLLFLVDLGLLMKYSKIQKTKNWVDAFFKVTKRKPNKEDMKSEDFQELNSFNSVLTLDFLWIFFGLITNSWKFFLLLLIVNFLFNILIFQMKSMKKIGFVFGFLKMSLITFSIGLLVINHFHLHKDLYEMVLRLI
jgi:hypothetical protein